MCAVREKNANKLAGTQHECKPKETSTKVFVHVHLLRQLRNTLPICASVRGRSMLGGTNVHGCMHIFRCPPTSKPPTLLSLGVGVFPWNIMESTCPGQASTSSKTNFRQTTQPSPANKLARTANLLVRPIGWRVLPICWQSET